MKRNVIAVLLGLSLIFALVGCVKGDSQEATTDSAAVTEAITESADTTTHHPEDHNNDHHWTMNRNKKRKQRVCCFLFVGLYRTIEGWILCRISGEKTCNF